MSIPFEKLSFKDIENIIRTSGENFYEYLRVYIIDDSAYLTLKKLASEAEVYILCGVIRDYFLGKHGVLRDLDLVIKRGVKINDYRKYLLDNYTTIKLNSFKGVKLISPTGPNVDLWQLENTWGIRHKGIKSPTPEELINTVFFNFSAITYDFNNRKFIFNHHFVDFLKTRVIDIVYEENPNIPLCLFNIFYYSKTLDLDISSQVRKWIRTNLSRIINFDNVQKKHLGAIHYKNEEIFEYLEKMGNYKAVYGFDWDKYLSYGRVKESERKKDGSGEDKRGEFESDFGRVVFSSAMRRMHDKTQVIPLTSGDKIHTRLTHSMEVMNTAHSLAFNLCRDNDFIAEYGEQKAVELERSICAILKTAAFVHDIGNPPFGHFGETVIKNYFKKYLNNHILCEKYKQDYEEFDGNAQGFRILTHLSYIGYLSGLNLTYATLATYLKYPNIGKVDKSYIGTKKHGIFQTEADVFNKIVDACGLKDNHGRVKRHPLSFLVEAADSICYNVMDIEDGFLLHWYNEKDIIDFLDNEVTALINNSQQSYDQFKETNGRYSFLKIIYSKSSYQPKPGPINRMHWIMNLRVQLIQYLVELANSNFKKHAHEIDNGTYSKELIEDDPFFVTKALQRFTQCFIFPKIDIQKAELTGYSVLNGLLSILIDYISSTDKEFRKRVKNILSKSALRVAIHESQPEKVYRYISEDELFNFDLANLSENAKLRLVVDFVSGMTDKFAVSLYQELSGLKI